MAKRWPHQIAPPNSSLYGNGHLLLLCFTQVVIRIDSDNAHLSFPLSTFFIVLLLARTFTSLSLHIQVPVTNKNLSFRLYRRPGDNIIQTNL